MLQVGDKVNRLTFIEYLGKKQAGRQKKYIRNYHYGLFQCECGKTRECFIHNVEKGKTKTCGCSYAAVDKSVFDYSNRRAFKIYIPRIDAPLRYGKTPSGVSKKNSD